MFADVQKTLVNKKKINKVVISQFNIQKSVTCLYTSNELAKKKKIKKQIVTKRIKQLGKET